MFEMSDEDAIQYFECIKELEQEKQFCIFIFKVNTKDYET